MSLAAQNKQLLSLRKSNASKKDKINSHILYVQSVQAVSFPCLGDSLSFRHHTMSVFVIVSLVFLFEWNRWPSDPVPTIYVVHLSSLHPFWENLDKRHENPCIKRERSSLHDQWSSYHFQEPWSIDQHWNKHDGWSQTWWPQPPPVQQTIWPGTPNTSCTKANHYL